MTLALLGGGYKGGEILKMSRMTEISVKFIVFGVAEINSETAKAVKVQIQPPLPGGVRGGGNLIL